MSKERKAIKENSSVLKILSILHGNIADESYILFTLHYSAEFKNFRSY